MLPQYLPSVHPFSLGDLVSTLNARPPSGAHSDGRKAGRREGWETGVRAGFDLGQEVGYIGGCVDVWAHHAALHPGHWAERAVKSIAALRRLVAAYPLCDAEDDQLQEALAKLRARFKVRRPPQGGFGGRVT